MGNAMCASTSKGGHLDSAGKDRSEVLPYEVLPYNAGQSDLNSVCIWIMQSIIQNQYALISWGLHLK